MSNFNTVSYDNLDKNLQLNQSKFNVINNASKDLYSTLLLTEDKGSNLWKLLKWSDVLSNHDKDRIAYTVDYLRISWKWNLIRDLGTKDFDQIRAGSTPGERCDKLCEILINKASNGMKDSERKEFIDDLKNHVDSAINAKDSMVSMELAEEMSLTAWSTKKFRRYWLKIKKILERNNNDISKCYMDVIKQACYAWASLPWRFSRRHLVPLKFEWRNIPKQTEKAQRALNERLITTKNKKEMLSIKYINDRLQEAFDHYLRTIWPSNEVFNTTSRRAHDLIMSE